ncbi:hypothetical protein [Nocardioides nitrophenolicus]|uniref:hypothetical protein n=1 Tax=Nocardioides nitrophenolicus TaxID=60489 RepID=UPI000ACF1352|nr:hypothetical protein [Nocardioides nitrophenolicus]MBM7519969.1 hypothetical protein [Nocardioides nitrophenolicus]
MNHFDELRIRDLAQVLTEFAGNCFEIARTTRGMSEYEHVQEARTAFLLLRGHGRALSTLVALGPTAYPSGWPIARSMFEVGVRTAWRMDVDDPFEAEGRWATWLQRFVAHELKRAESLEAEGLPEMAQRARRRADQSARFHAAFVDLLNAKGIVPAAQEPSMKNVLKALGQPPHRYQLYADASEQLHGSFVALEAHSRGLGTERKLGEFATWMDWASPLTTGIRGIQALSYVFSDRVRSERMQTVVESAEDAWELALHAERH